MKQTTSYLVKRCGQCEKLVNVFVNRDHCPYCRAAVVRIGETTSSGGRHPIWGWEQ